MTGKTDEPDRKASRREDKIDQQMKDTFPASDPPSYSGGNHIVGAPPGRESEAAAAPDADVADDRKKIPRGKAKK
ncbi:MAG TPA: hypothetical protein VFS01_07015 [Rhizomicrobium sp.]|jgi:hypothetical protein|nr:hypothetical protein [Rhizomicrobium sp.]